MLPWKFVTFSDMQFAHFVNLVRSLYSLMHFEQKSLWHSEHSFGSTTIKKQNLQVKYSSGSYKLSIRSAASN